MVPVRQKGLAFGRMLASGKRFNQSKAVLYDSVSFKDGKLATE